MVVTCPVATEYYYVAFTAKLRNLRLSIKTNIFNLTFGAFQAVIEQT